jgi:hypothetical protein
VQSKAASAPAFLNTLHEDSALASDRFAVLGICGFATQFHDMVVLRIALGGLRPLIATITEGRPDNIEFSRSPSASTSTKEVPINLGATTSPVATFAPSFIIAAAMWCLRLTVCCDGAKKQKQKAEDDDVIGRTG